MSASNFVEARRSSTKCIDLNTGSRQAWLVAMQGDLQIRQHSDFEKSLVWRSTLIAAVIVIGINLLSPTPAAVQPAHIHATT
jgi:hypothetical protein